MNVSLFMKSLWNTEGFQQIASLDQHFCLQQYTGYSDKFTGQDKYINILWHCTIGAKQM